MFLQNMKAESKTFTKNPENVVRMVAQMKVDLPKVKVGSSIQMYIYCIVFLHGKSVCLVCKFVHK